MSREVLFFGSAEMVMIGKVFHGTAVERFRGSIVMRTVAFANDQTLQEGHVGIAVWVVAQLAGVVMQGKRSRCGSGQGQGVTGSGELWVMIVWF